MDEKEVKTVGEDDCKDWWDINGKGKLLHRMNKLRVPQVRDGIINNQKTQLGETKPSSSVSILDIGCGAGILTEALARLDFIVHGVDVTPHLHQVAKLHASLDPSLVNLAYFLKPIEDFAKDEAEKYDAVIISMLEHVPDQELYLKECIKCVKPGGSIFITTFHKTTYAWFISIIMFEYVLRYIPRGHHHWDEYISVEDTKRILEKFNCKIVKVENWCYGNGEWRHAARMPITYSIHAIKN